MDLSEGAEIVPIFQKRENRIARRRLMHAWAAQSMSHFFRRTQERDNRRTTSSNWYRVLYRGTARVFSARTCAASSSGNTEDTRAGSGPPVPGETIRPPD